MLGEAVAFSRKQPGDARPVHLALGLMAQSRIMRRVKQDIRIVRLHRDEKRHVSRLRTPWAGKLLSGGGSHLCWIRNISETGAKIEITEDVEVPETFELMVREGLVVPCIRRWTRQRTVGVEFVRRGQTKDDAPTPS
jgi:hypothetical protein